MSLRPRLALLTPLIATLAACTVVTVPPPTRTQDAAAPIVITNDRGGNVLHMLARRSELAATGRPVEIRGACDSACTMLITLPNACLASDATVGFHAPRLPDSTVIPPLVDEIMAAQYRNGIRARWMAEWRHSLKIHRISAREYVALDPDTRLCRR